VKVQIKSSGNNIINQKEYFIKFRPYAKEMLRGLKSFFELLVYTSKSKDEAEAIVNALEYNEGGFFSYIVPFNHSYYN
jgi:TFIIF-interacting CTD phosphatase-like protein